MGGSFLLSPSIFFGSAGKTSLRRPHPPKRSSPGFSLAFPRFFSFCRYDFVKSEHRSGGPPAGSTRPRLQRGPSYASGPPADSRGVRLLLFLWHSFSFSFRGCLQFSVLLCK